ncbi:MAG: pilus assembly protein PilM [Muribaculaceae bacterium]|nr:pilus assembly protein PilM [Muribaculaceae bacterium]
MDQKYIVAIELAGTQIRGALSTVHNPTGMMPIPNIEAIAATESDDCVQYGRVQNLINAAKCTSDVLRSLQNESMIADGKINRVYVGIGGRSLGSEKVSASIVLPSEMVISQDVLRNLFMEATKMKSQNKNVLKVLPRKFYVDNNAMPNPVGALGRHLKGDFTLVTCNPVNQRNMDLVLGDRMNLKVEKYIVTPLALADMLLGEEEKQRGCMLVDLGAQTTTLSVYKDRALQYIAVLPIGSHNITRDIAMGMNLTMEKAENAKLSIGDAQAQPNGSDETSRTNNYVVARAYELVINIIANIEYAGYTQADLPAGFILAGRGSRLTNFDNLLSAQSKMKVRHASMPSNVNFAFNTTSRNVDDYLSLVALVMRVSKSPNFISCVDFPHKEETPAEPVIPAEPEIRQAPVLEKEIQIEPEDEGADDNNWQKDDETPDPAPKNKEEEKPAPPKNKKRSFLDRMKEKMTNILSNDGLDDDTQL